MFVSSNGKILKALVLKKYIYLVVLYEYKQITFVIAQDYDKSLIYFLV